MKKPKAPRLVTVAITTTITIIFWIFFALYQVLTTKPIPSVDPKFLEPINPSLDINNLEKIKDRVFFEEGSFIPPVIPVSPTTNVEIPVQVKEATQSASQ